MTNTTNRRRRTALAFIAAVAAATVTTGPASATTHTTKHPDPHASHAGQQVSQRAAGDTVIWRTAFQDMGINLWRSTSGYKWVQITNTGGRPSEAAIYSDRTGWRYSTSYGRSPSSYTTPVVYAPGSTCVLVRLNAVALRGGSASQTWRVC